MNYEIKELDDLLMVSAKYGLVDIFNEVIAINKNNRHDLSNFCYKDLPLTGIKLINKTNDRRYIPRSVFVSYPGVCVSVKNTEIIEIIKKTFDNEQNCFFC